MITKDYLEKRWDEDRSGLAVYELAHELLKERDQLAKKLADMENMKEAYRDVARFSGHICHITYCLCGHQVDEEAHKILKQADGTGKNTK